MRNRIPIQLSTIILAAALAPVAAVADDDAGLTPGEDRPRERGDRLLLMRADADRDGTVTAEEWHAMVAAIGEAFATLDHDADGEVSVGHRGRERARRMPRHLGAPMGRRMEGRDRPGHRARRVGGLGLHRAADQAGDGDGVLSRDEWLDFLGDADTDSDGRLGPEELRAVMTSLHPDRVTPTGPAVEDLIERFDQADANGDGLLSDDEQPPRRSRRPRE